MKNHFSKYIVLLLLVCSLFAACILDQGPVFVDPCPCDVTPFIDCDCDQDTSYEISFEADIFPFLEKYCAICHGNDCLYVNFKKGVAYENIIRYVNWQNPVGSVVYQSIILKFMPPEGEYTSDSVLITTDLIPSALENNLLLEWIKQGALDN